MSTRYYDDWNESPDQTDILRHDGGSQPLISLPRSVREKLERAEEAVRWKRPSEAAHILAEVGQELARQAPELVALLLAANMGERGIEATVSEILTSSVATEKQLFGITYGRDVKTTTTTKTVSKSLRLG